MQLLDCEIQTGGVQQPSPPGLADFSICMCACCIALSRFILVSLSVDSRSLFPYGALSFRCSFLSVLFLPLCSLPLSPFVSSFPCGSLFASLLLLANLCLLHGPTLSSPPAQLLACALHIFYSAFCRVRSASSTILSCSSACLPAYHQSPSLFPFLFDYFPWSPIHSIRFRLFIRFYCVAVVRTFPLENICLCFIIALSRC